MKRVILESPFMGHGRWPWTRRWNRRRNVAYARACLRDTVLRGESAMASHLLWTQPGVLDDDKPAERKLGIEAGLAWGPAAEATVAYVDRGWSNGMRAGVARAEQEGRKVEVRVLRGQWARRPGLDWPALLERHFGSALLAAISIGSIVPLLVALLAGWL